MDRAAWGVQGWQEVKEPVSQEARPRWQRPSSEGRLRSRAPLLNWGRWLVVKGRAQPTDQGWALGRFPGPELGKRCQSRSLVTQIRVHGGIRGKKTRPRVPLTGQRNHTSGKWVQPHGSPGAHVRALGPGLDQRTEYFKTRPPSG